MYEITPVLGSPYVAHIDGDFEPYYDENDKLVPGIVYARVRKPSEHGPKRRLVALDKIKPID